ncbi:hypothetical protein V2W45_1327495 [Cenococcum geophilum]
MPNVPGPPPPPPLPPPPPFPPPVTITTAATTAAVATALNPSASHSPPKVSFRDNMVRPFKPKFYVDLDLLKKIGSYLNVKIPFRLMLLTTLYLRKNSLKCKAESLLKIMENINNAVARQLSKKVIKSNNEVRALISALRERAILSLKNINEINKCCFEPKLC